MSELETKVKYHQRRFEALKSVRQPWEAQWQELAEFNAPARLRFITDQGAGQKLRSKLVDSTSTFALRTLASGMHSGITSPARPWFRLTTYDDDLKEFAPVKEYLAAVETKMREVFQASNLYNAFHIGYADLGLFGQSVALLVEDAERVIRMIPLLHGSFWLARDGAGVANTLYRQFKWSVEKIVKRFGYKKCSLPVQRAYDKGDYDTKFDIYHAVEPRHERDRSKIDKINKPFLSNYWEEGGSELLEESGFDDNPIIAPPWELIAEDDYGVSPGMDVLPDVKALQMMQLRKGEAIDKQVRPPMVAPTSMRNNPKSTMPGGVTYVDDTGGQKFEPAMKVTLQLGELANEIQSTSQRIDRGYYADLFLMLANMEGIQPRNNFEIAERKEEKLLALGPVLENIYGGQLAPTIDRTYGIMEQAGKLPPPPEEIQGQELKIEYISMLAQAQKAISTGSIERLFAFSGNLAAIKPGVVDKLDFDEAVDIYSDLLGADPKLIISDEDVAKERQARAEAEQKLQQAESAVAMAPAMREGAEAARIMSETDASGQNILQKIGVA